MQTTGDMYPEPHGDTAACVDNVRHSILIRRLQRSRIENALLQKKAQRHVALKAFQLSIELRRQLTRAQAAADSEGSGTNSSASEPANPPPPIDPSIKALIEKLTEVAELLPTRYGGEQASSLPGLRSSPHRAMLGSNDPNDKSDGYSQRRPARWNHAAQDTLLSPTPPTVSRGVPGSFDRQGRPRSEPGTEDGWDDAEPSRNPDVVLPEKGVSGGFDGDDEARDDSRDAGKVSTKLVSVDPLDHTMSRQLQELDSNVNSLFQDLEQKAIQAVSAESDATGTTRENAARQDRDAEKQRAEKARKRERALLLAQLERKNAGHYRRPKWRWIADGVPNPDPERILKGKHFWRAAVFLVIMFYVRPRKQLLARKARSKDRDAQDWNTTLTIYFDRCQTWLLKTSRVPIGNSVLKNFKLSFRLNRLERDAYGTSAQGNTGGGFASKLVRAVTRGMTHENLELTLTRLKVHAKGVLHGITQEMPPSDIMTFFSYLSGDGNYFPEGFFFAEEARVLSFDDLGAVRLLAAGVNPPDNLDETLYALHPSGLLQQELELHEVDQSEGFLEKNLAWLHAGVAAGSGPGKDGKSHKAEAPAGAAARPTDLRAAVLHGKTSLPGKLRPVYRHDANGQWFDTSLVEMILTNYLMVRVLIPWVLLYPRESGLIPSSGMKQSLLTHNCQVLASTVYLIMRVLRPELTPPNGDTIKAAAVHEAERAMTTAVRDDEGGELQGQDNASEGSSDGEGEENSATTQGATDAVAPKAASGETNNSNVEGNAKKIGARRRGSVLTRVALKPRTVQQIMQQRRYLSVSDKQLVMGLLPDAYFMPFAEQLRPWVLTLAAEFDSWMQKVIVQVMGKIEGSLHRHERASKEPAGERGG